MAENMPGPYEIEYELTGWTSPARNHLFRVSVAALGSPAAGALPTTIDIQKMGGSTAKLNVVANQLWEFLRNMYHTSISCTSYQLWKYVPGTLAKDFISAGTVTNPAALSGTTAVVAGQLTQTYRSARNKGGTYYYTYPLLCNQTREIATRASNCIASTLRPTSNF